MDPAATRVIFMGSPVFAEPSLRAFFQAWAEAVLGNRQAPPDGDATGDGLTNLWHFLWSLNPRDPEAPHPPRPWPRLTRDDSKKIFSWELPAPDGVTWRLEGTPDLAVPWQPLAPEAMPMPGRPGWVVLRHELDESSVDKWFHRLVFTTDWN